MKSTYRITLMVLIGLITRGTFGQIPEEGLILFFPFNGNATDVSGYGNHGIPSGVALTQDRCGAPDSAFRFDGIESNIYVNDSPSLNPSTITLCAWVKPVSFRGHGNSAIISKGFYRHDPPYYQYHLGITGDLYPNTPSCFSFCVSVNNEYHIITGDSLWIPGKWHFVVGTYDGTFMKLYVNAHLIATKNVDGNIDPYGQPLAIALTRNLGTEGYTPATLDDIRIYNRALNNTEIGSLFYSHCLMDSIYGQDVVCPGQQSLDYMVNNVEHAESYQWSYSGQGVTLRQNRNHVEIDYADEATSGVLSVKVSGTDFSEVQTSRSILIRALPQTPEPITGPSTLCQNQNTPTYTVSPVMNATDYVWNFTGSNAYINQYLNSVTIQFLNQPTSGILSVAGKNGCGTGPFSDPFPITTVTYPEKAGPITGVHEVCSNQGKVTFSVPALPENTSYAWAYSGTGITLVETMNSVDAYVLHDATSGNLTVSGFNACGSGEASEPFPIVVSSCLEQPGDLFIPNSFTPNADGTNDFFEIPGLPLNSHLKIYNRSGALIYSSDDYQNNWSGTDLENKSLETGVYWYVLELKSLTSAIKGFVYLKR